MGRKMKRLRIQWAKERAEKAAAAAVETVSVAPVPVETVSVAPVPVETVSVAPVPVLEPEPEPVVEVSQARPKRKSSLRSRLSTKRTKTKRTKE